MNASSSKIPTHLARNDFLYPLPQISFLSLNAGDCENGYGAGSEVKLALYLGWDSQIMYSTYPIPTTASEQPATEQYFPVMLFIMLYKEVQTFESYFVTFHIVKDFKYG